MSMNYVLKLNTCPNNPAYSCVFEPPNSKLFEKSKLTLPLRLRVLPLLEDSKIDLGVVDDVTMSDTPPWSQPEPHICLPLTNSKKKRKKDCTSPEIYEQAFWKLHHNTKSMFSFLRMVPKSREGCRLQLQQYHLLLQIIPSNVG